MEGECFASPLNVTLHEFYCSAFPDTDAPFSSQGCFFSLHLRRDLSPASDQPSAQTLLQRGGSFEANPPFLEELMLAMYLYMKYLLDHCHASLTAFVIFVPTWEDTPAIEAMNACRYLRGKFRFEKHAHSYRAGFQHLPDKEQTRIPYSSTFVFVLQNESAAKKWKVDALEDMLGMNHTV